MDRPDPLRLHRRRILLTAAAALFPYPALATTFDLSNQSVNVATAPYTAADTLNATNVTFTSSVAGGSLFAALNLNGNDTVNTSTGLTLAGALSGSATLFKNGTGALTLSALSPSFTGPVTVNFGAGTLRLGIESPLSGPGTLTLGNSTTLDLNGFNSPGRPITLSSSASVVNNNTAATSTFSSSLPPYTLSLGGAGSLTLATPLQGTGAYTKVGTGPLTIGAASPSFNGNFFVSAGILSLGIASPFSSSAHLTVDSGGSLDLNGFNAVGTNVSLFGGAALVNNNVTATSTLSSLLPFSIASPFTLGGAGNINLTTRVNTFTKIGAGTVSLSAGYTTTSNGTLTINDGTVRLNIATALGNASSSPTINLKSTANTGGILDLNGYPAPAGTYNFNGGILANDNTASPSTVDFSTVQASGSQPIMFGGSGELVVTGLTYASFYRFGPGTGTLTLNPSASSSPNGTVLAGTLRLGNLNQHGTFTLYGSSYQYPFRATVVDLNGLFSPSISLNLNNNAGIVNNNTSTPVTVGESINLHITSNAPPPTHIVLGGEGTLNVVSSTYLSGYPIDKVGAGLLTLPSGFSSWGVTLRGGTLQAEADSQLGGSFRPISFLGGTLRVAPLYLAPANSYTFTSAISVDPTTGGTLDTQRNSTFTGSLTGSGPFTKTGSASATLNPAPSSRLALSVQTGTLYLRPTTGTPAITSLSLSPATTLDVAGNLVLDYTGQSPADAVRQYLASHQLTSAAVAADPAHLTLACLEASTLLSLTGSQTATWSGQPVDATTLLLQVARFGDANLNGKIDADDYALIDRAFAQSLTNAYWTDGDFNYDGAITSADYLLIDSTLASQSPLSPEFLSMRESQFGADYVSNLLTAVPEPTSLTACGFAILAPLARRRRSRSAPSHFRQINTPASQ